MLKSFSLPWTRWLILSLLVSLLLISAPEPTDPAAKAAFQNGQALVKKGRQEQDPALIKAAQEAYQRVIPRRLRDPQPWQGLGRLDLIQGQFEQAYQAFFQSLRRGGKGAATDRGLAQVYAGLGDHRRAVESWAAYLSRKPKDRDARLALVRSAIIVADWARARAELEHLLADDPADTTAHTWLGLLLLGPEPKMGRPHLQRAIQDPASSDCLTPVLKAERLSLVSEDPAYRSALLGIAFLKLDPQCLASSDQQHASLRYQTDTKDFKTVTSMLALRSLLAATHRNPAYAEAYAYLGQTLDQLGWPGWARAALERALELAPNSPVALTLMGMYWDRHDVPSLARRYYRSAYEPNQSNVALCLEIAATYAAEGDYTAAEAWLLAATQIAPNDPHVWELLARFYVERGNNVKASALPAAERYLKLAPGDARAHDLVGWAYFLIQDEAQAKTHLRQALSIDPTLAAAYYHLGRLHAQQSRFAEAAQAYRRAENHGLQGRWRIELDRAWEQLPQTYRRPP